MGGVYTQGKLLLALAGLASYNSWMLVNLGIIIFGVLLFLFIFWKKLKEDYAGEIIFKSAARVLFGVAIGYLFSRKFYADWFIFLETAGAFLGLAFSVYSLRINFYESLEALVLAFMPWLSLFFLAHSVKNSSLSSFLGFLTILFIILFYFYLDSHYKQFNWYRSGRVGFVGLTTLSLIFFIRSMVATFNDSMLSFVGRFETVVSGGLVIICVTLLYKLSFK